MVPRSGRASMVTGSAGPVSRRSMSASRTVSQICCPPRDSTRTRGRPGAARSPTSTRVSTTRPAKGARTTDSPATEVAALDRALGLLDGALGLLVLHSRHVQLEVGGGAFSAAGPRSAGSCVRPGQGRPGPGPGRPGLGQLSLAGLGLDLQQRLALGDRRAGGDVDGHHRSHDPAGNEAWRAGGRCRGPRWPCRRWWLDRDGGDGYGFKDGGACSASSWPQPRRW